MASTFATALCQRSVAALPSFVAAAALLGAMPNAAFAQDKPGPRGPGGPGGPDNSGLSIGVGVVSAQKAYKGLDRETKAKPLLSFENSYLRIFGPSLELKLPKIPLDEAQSLDVRAVVSGEMNGEMSGYEASDAAIFSGMTERKSGIWAGAKAKWQTGLVDVNAQWLADASSNSKGQNISLGISKDFPIAKGLMLMPRIGATWYDDKYVDYYYGVRSTEATGNRAMYAGKASTNIDAGVMAMYRLAANQSLMLNLSMSSLGNGIKQSSLVDRSMTNAVMLGYTYRF